MSGILSNPGGLVGLGGSGGATNLGLLPGQATLTGAVSVPGLVTVTVGSSPATSPPTLPTTTPAVSVSTPGVGATVAPVATPGVSISTPVVSTTVTPVTTPTIVAPVTAPVVTPVVSVTTPTTVGPVTAPGDGSGSTLSPLVTVGTAPPVTPPSATTPAPSPPPSTPAAPVGPTSTPAPAPVGDHGGASGGVVGGVVDLLAGLTGSGGASTAGTGAMTGGGAAAGGGATGTGSVGSGVGVAVGVGVGVSSGSATGSGLAAAGPVGTSPEGHGSGVPDPHTAYANIFGLGGDISQIPAAMQAQLLQLDALVASGAITPQQAVLQIINAASGTTAVAETTYQFFTGLTPSQAGLTYLVHSDANLSDLGDAYYQGFNLENRYINFAANLGLHSDYSPAFASTFGPMSYDQAVRTAYDRIIGQDAALRAGINVEQAISDIEGRKAYFDQVAAERFGTADHDLAVKLTTIAYILEESVRSNTGHYGESNQNFLYDLADGQAQFHVNLVATYDHGTALDVIP